MPDGSIYYGQVVDILPFELRPKDGSCPPGFRKLMQHIVASSSRATSIDVASDHTTKIEEYNAVNDSPLIVDDMSLVPDELHAHITKVRHGFGI